MTEAAAKSDFVPLTSTGLTPKDAQVLLEGLVQGDQALARRKDLGDLYKRLVAMLTTLDAGLSDRQNTRADQENAVMSDRLDRLERSINGVEGVLRIEMDQLIRQAIADAGLGLRSDGSGHRSGRRLIQLAALCACVLVGAAFSDQIRAFQRSVQTAIVTEANRALLQQSPDGGSLSSQNQVK